MKLLTGVGAIISAAHQDRLTGVLHGHTYAVTAWYLCENSNDAVVLQNHLRGVCEEWDHTTLPLELSRAEDLAAAILRLSPPSCIEVEIRRDAERLYAKALA